MPFAHILIKKNRTERNLSLFPTDNITPITTPRGKKEKNQQILQRGIHTESRSCEWDFWRCVCLCICIPIHLQKREANKTLQVLKLQNTGFWMAELLYTCKKLLKTYRGKDERQHMNRRKESAGSHGWTGTAIPIRYSFKHFKSVCYH